MECCQQWQCYCILFACYDTCDDYSPTLRFHEKHFHASPAEVSTATSLVLVRLYNNFAWN